MKQGVEVEVFYFEGCPNHGAAVEQVWQALLAEAMTGSPIREIEVRDAAMAESLRFLGSPSVRVGGVDIEPSARDAQSFGFGCRTYFDEGGRSGLPPVAMIRKALAEVSGRGGEEGGRNG